MTKIGAWSQFGSWTAFDQGAGQMDVYRGYDNGFRYATWQQIPSGQRYRGPQNLASVMNDYSFRIPPAQLAAGALGRPAAHLHRLHAAQRGADATTTSRSRRSRPASSPSPSSARPSSGSNRLVDAQNADRRRHPQGVGHPDDLDLHRLPGPERQQLLAHLARDGGTVDLISADVYNAPHGTGTAVPLGYTTGINWKTPAGLVRPVLTFAGRTTRTGRSPSSACSRT